MYKKKIQYMIIVLLCMMTFTTCKMILGDVNKINPGHSPKVDNEMMDDISKLQSLGTKHDFVGLEKYSETLQKKWSQKEWNDYAYVLYRISSAFNSYYFDNDKSYTLARMYAMLALSDTRPLSLERESDFVRLTTRWFIDLQKCPCGKDRRKIRKDEAVLWLNIWKQTEANIDRAYDPNDIHNMVYLNVPPPRGARFHISGMSPTAIEDPKIRAEYEADIKKNNDKLKKLNEQIALKRMEKEFLPQAQRFIIFIYSQSPDATSELQDLLDKNVTDQTKRKEIMDAVKANLARAAANKPKPK